MNISLSKEQAGSLAWILNQIDFYYLTMGVYENLQQMQVLTIELMVDRNSRLTPDRFEILDDGSLYSVTLTPAV